MTMKSALNGNLTDK